MKKYNIGYKLPNGSIIVDGPQRINKHTKWLVECSDCGNRSWKFSNTFNNAKWGCKICYDKSMRREDQRPAILRAFISLTSNAKSRNIDVEISENDFFYIASKNCYFCGDKPIEKKPPKKWQASVYLNGIDRLDNTKGYTVENSVACCYTCNSMKSNNSLDIFMKKIKTIYERHIA